jgi:uncharacterized membrane protein YkoI
MKSYLLILSALWTVNASAHEHGAFEGCLQTALKQQPGHVVKVELKLEDAREVYEFDIDTIDGREIKLEIDATSGEIVEINEERWQVGLE